MITQCKGISAMLVLALTVPAGAQNLVPNPGFEDTISCPAALAKVDIACAEWTSYGNSPDYYNTCSASNGISPPGTWFGYQYPQEGNAYTGLMTICYGCGNGNHREHIGATLLSPLQAGVTYFVSLYAQQASVYPVRIATNNLGVMFTNTAYGWTKPVPLNNLSHVYADSILMDSLAWTLIWGWFVADSAYQYIAIGNFFDDAHTDTVNTDTFSDRSYYFIDQVCVSTDSTDCLSVVGVHEPQPGGAAAVWPNPFTSTLTVAAGSGGLAEVRLFDITGRIVMQHRFLDTFTFDTERLAPGYYVYETTVGARPAGQDRLVKH